MIFIKVSHNTIVPYKILERSVYLQVEGTNFKFTDSDRRHVIIPDTTLTIDYLREKFEDKFILVGAGMLLSVAILADSSRIWSEDGTICYYVDGNLWNLKNCISVDKLFKLISTDREESD